MIRLFEKHQGGSCCQKKSAETAAQLSLFLKLVLDSAMMADMHGGCGLMMADIHTNNLLLQTLLVLDFHVQQIN